MAYYADSLSESQRDALRKLRETVRTHVINQSIIPRIEMLVGPWQVDEYGNQTREIKARD
jgi:hypothetical protein